MSHRSRPLVLMTILFAACAGPRFETNGVRSWHGVKTERQLQMVIVLSSLCAEARKPAFRNAVRRLAAGVERRARLEGLRFVTIGVSLDVSLDDGLKALAGLVPFNELSVGNSWLNGAAQTFVWSTVPGLPAIPQVVVVERHISVRENGLAFGGYSLRGRMVGTDEIKDGLRLLGLPVDSARSRY